MEEKPKGLSEDWLAVWIGLFIFVVSLGAFAGKDILGWIVTTGVWTDVSKALKPFSVTGMGGITSLVLTYVVLTVIMTVGAVALKADVKKFVIGFTIVFWISYICWILGSWANIAVTTAPDMKKFGITWSLKLTAEAGFIIALLVGLFFGNFVPSFANAIKEAVRPELYIKTAIVILGGSLGMVAAEKLGLATAVMFRGLCAIIEAYLIYWALVYFIARKYFKFSREWAAPLASGISICGVSAAIATGGAIKARPVVPIMVSSLVVIFAVVELIILPFIAETYLYKEPMVAGAWMGLAVKTDGAAVAAGAVAEGLILGKNAAEGVMYQPEWIKNAAAVVKVFIDIFIGVWAFVLAIIWSTVIERKAGEKASAVDIWHRFPKFVIGYVVTFLIILWVCLPA
ncbi:MAG TPA: putative sulfate exporter family transporter, partial [Nitrospirota bacterium]